MAKKILLANGDSRLGGILAGHDLTTVHTLADAQRALARERYELVVISVHFDESRMFDLLRHLQACGTHAGRPIACVRDPQTTWPEISIEGLEIATKALGANLFLDLTWYADDAIGNAAVRQLLDALLG